MTSLIFLRNAEKDYGSYGPCVVVLLCFFLNFCPYRQANLVPDTL